MCSQKQISYNEMRLDIFLVAHTKLRYRLIVYISHNCTRTTFIMNGLCAARFHINVTLAGKDGVYLSGLCGPTDP